MYLLSTIIIIITNYFDDHVFWQGRQHTTNDTFLNSAMAPLGSFAELHAAAIHVTTLILFAGVLSFDRRNRIGTCPPSSIFQLSCVSSIHTAHSLVCYTCITRIQQHTDLRHRSAHITQTVSHMLQLVTHAHQICARHQTNHVVKLNHIVAAQLDNLTLQHPWFQFEIELRIVMPYHYV